MSSLKIDSLEELRIIVTNVASTLGLSEAVIEKDYWVTFVLDYLFNSSEWNKYLTFKGGTSLSKCFNLIERFSEDIDLILDWKVLGYKENEPYEERSNRGQEKYNKELNEATEDFLANKFLPKIKLDFENHLDFEFSFSIDVLDKQTILFEYPRIFTSNYLSQSIRLEIGALASKIPAKEITIQPLISEVYPKLFQNKVNIKSITAERTFLEKLTILHHEAHRPETSKLPLRYARHYYDVYKMYDTEIKKTAINDYGLLFDVINFKSKFYRRNWAKYDDILERKLKLVPSPNRLEELHRDYQSMEEMIYGDYPSFNELVKVLKDLENEINSLEDI